MCKSSKSNKSNAKANVMIDKKQWLALPFHVSENQDATFCDVISPAQVFFHNLPKLSAFTISGKHSALKDIKGSSNKTFILLKTGYSSALIVEVKGGTAEYNFSVLTKKVMFKDDHKVTPLATHFVYSAIQFAVAPEAPEAPVPDAQAAVDAATTPIA